MEYLYFFIILLIIMVLFLPLGFKVKASYNFFGNKGAMGVFFLGIKVKSFIFKIGLNKIMLFDGKKSEIEIDLLDNEAVYAEQLAKVMVKKINLKDLQINYNFGVEDSCQTAMICGLINLVVFSFFAQAKLKFPKSSLLLCDNPAYNQMIFEVAFSSRFSLSIISFAYSLINSAILLKKKKNQ